MMDAARKIFLKILLWVIAVLIFHRVARKVRRVVIGDHPVAQVAIGGRRVVRRFVE